MKKFLTMFFLGAFAVALVACGGEEKKDGDKEGDKKEEKKDH